ncbi:MAG: exodeoxyribonuclease III [Firmicutes bacterium]|nr:exodeoxyribonuclease III [Bacillota bacterium]
MNCKMISWNVNGLRACIKKGFEDSMKALDPDFICIQETKMQEGQAAPDLPDYEEYYSYADKKGYSGTAIFTKHTPLSVQYNFGDHTDEGRLTQLEYEDFYLLCVYVPNARLSPKEYEEERKRAEKKGEPITNRDEALERFNYRIKWEDDFREYVKKLAKKKHVIVCGDMNVAHQEIDLKNPKPNRGNCGFTDEEREKMTALLDAGFIDTFRYKYPDKEDAYSWWSYRFNARANNSGWRIDYFLTDSAFSDKIIDASIHPEIEGSDHCPVELLIDCTL